MTVSNLYKFIGMQLKNEIFFCPSSFREQYYFSSKDIFFKDHAVVHIKQTGKNYFCIHLCSFFLSQLHCTVLTL